MAVSVIHIPSLLMAYVSVSERVFPRSGCVQVQVPSRKFIDEKSGRGTGTGVGAAAVICAVETTGMEQSAMAKSAHPSAVKAEVFMAKIRPFFGTYVPKVLSPNKPPAWRFLPAAAVFACDGGNVGKASKSTFQNIPFAPARPGSLGEEYAMRIRSWIPCAVAVLFAACGQPQTTPIGSDAQVAPGASLPAQPAGRTRLREFVLYNFYQHSSNGGHPRGGLAVGLNGSLFGTTNRGGMLRCPDGKASCGTVYIMANTDSGYLEFPLYRFCEERGCADGALPYADVTVDKGGALYGTTYEGGTNNSGVVFKLTPKRDGSYKESVLYSFCPQAGCEDGSYPRSDVIRDATGAIYGTTLYGGSKNSGVVFKLTPSSSGYTESVLHAFTGADGLYPEAGVVADAGGALYGTTATGGGSGCDTGCGVVFKLTPSGSQYTETVLHAFTGGDDGTDPYAGLLLDKHGNLFGVTAEGGGTGCYGNGCGVVFEMKRAGTAYSESVLHAFAGTDGSAPVATLAFGKQGEIYGTTSSGGLHRGGTVFAMRHAHSSYEFRSLYNFCKLAKCADGEAPLGGVVLYGNAIFGTTWQGGAKSVGTVYELIKSNG